MKAARSERILAGILGAIALTAAPTEALAQQEMVNSALNAANNIRSLQSSGVSSQTSLAVASALNGKLDVGMSKVDSRLDLACTQSGSKSTVKNSKVGKYGKKNLSVEGTFCTRRGMPLYDQDAFEKSFCGPTSAAMALSYIFNSGIKFKEDSWTAKNIYKKEGKKWVLRSEKEQIDALGEKMKTNEAITGKEGIDDVLSFFGADSESGTGLLLREYSFRDKDFDKAKSVTGKALVDASNWGEFSAKTMKLDSAFWAGKGSKDTLAFKTTVPLMVFGHYKQTCGELPDQSVRVGGDGKRPACKYDRKSGHIVAVNGYLTAKDATYVYIHEPHGYKVLLKLDKFDGSDNAKVKEPVYERKCKSIGRGGQQCTTKQVGTKTVDYSKYAVGPFSSKSIMFQSKDGQYEVPEEYLAIKFE